MSRIFYQKDFITVKRGGGQEPFQKKGIPASNHQKIKT